MNIHLTKPHIIGYEKGSVTAGTALEMVKNIKNYLEEQLENSLRMEIDYGLVGVNSKTFFHLYEAEPWIRKFLYAITRQNKRQALLSISIGSCGGWTLNDITCNIYNPKIHEIVFNRLYQYAEQHALAVT